MQVIHFVLAFLISGTYCKNVHHRNPRHIWGPYTKTVIETSVVKSWIPSSCIHVEPSLPPCRGVRFLKFPMFTAAANQLQGINESNAEAKIDPIVQTTEPGWAEYLGFYAPTVTVTKVELSTTIVQDPRIVVTFAVKGCRPHEMPTDLQRCPQEATPVLIEDALPTSTVPSINATPILPIAENTKLVDIEEATSFPVRAFEEIQGNLHLEGTSDILEDAETARATAPLSF